MRNGSCFLPMILLLLFAVSCRSRECTLNKCFCKRPALHFLIEREPFGDDPIDFEREDLDHFYFLQVENVGNSETDSSKINFMKIERDQSYYLFELNEATFGDSIDLRLYDFRIVNRPIDLVDSITDMSYAFRDTTFVCNECDPPPDEYITCPWVRDLRFLFNGQEIGVPDNDVNYTSAILIKP